VTVVHPAYANRKIYMRNDEEIVSVEMAATAYDTANRPAPGPASVGAAAVTAARAALPTAPNRVEIQYIPSMVRGRRIGRDVEYSSIYMLLGGGGHSLAFSSEKGIVLVNTKSPGWGKAIHDRLPEITEAPVAAIINTQPGLPYTGNNDAFAGTVPIVAHENTLVAMRQLPAFAGANARFLPNRTFTDTLTLFEGKSRVDVYYFGPAHTNGDAVVAIPFSNLAYAGELLPAREVPVIDRARGGSAVAYVDTLTKALAALKAAGIEFIVPGRAEPRRGRMQVDVMAIKDLEEYRDFNRALLDAVKAAKQAGKSADQAAASLALPERFKAYGMQPAKAYVQAAYEELK
jgi:glyoxylase-like metal-dependent hydrolase (beta-lactamase superfamily II)